MKAGDGSSMNYMNSIRNEFANQISHEYDPEENERKRKQAEAIQKERNRRKIINMEGMVKLIKSTLLKHGLNKASADTTKVIQNMMEKFYEEKLIKLSEICRLDQSRTENVLVHINRGQDSCVAPNSNIGKINEYQLRNKNMSTTGKEEVSNYAQMSTIYTSDIKATLTQADSDLNVMLKQKKERAKQIQGELPYFSLILHIFRNSKRQGQRQEGTQKVK